MKQKEFKKVISLVLILMSFICLNCLQAKAAVLRQTSGEKVTARGQQVTFGGTNGYNQASLEALADLKLMPKAPITASTDQWLVVQLEGDRALIIKQYPIAVQHWATGNKVIYDQSDIKASVAAWQAKLETLTIAGLPFTDYMCPVTLHGTGQSSPNGRNQAEQRRYQTEVDPANGAIQFFVPSLIDVAQEASRTDGLDVGVSTWESFVAVAGIRQYTWLRSPLFCEGCMRCYDTIKATYIDYGGFINCDFGDVNEAGGTYSVRPACWVRV